MLGAPLTSNIRNEPSWANARKHAQQRVEYIRDRYRHLWLHGATGTENNSVARVTGTTCVWDGPLTLTQG
jgi:hypothetical protein